MEANTRPVRARRFNSQQKFVVELSTNQEKQGKAKAAPLQKLQSSSKKVLSDLTNTDFLCKDRPSRANARKQLEKTAADMPGSLKSAVLDSVSKDTRGSLIGSAIIKRTKGIGQGRSNGKMGVGNGSSRISPVSNKLDSKLETVALPDSTENAGNGFVPKANTCKTRRVEKMVTGISENGSGHNAMKPRAEKGASKSKQIDEVERCDKDSLLPLAVTSERKLWRSGAHEQGSVKLFASDLKKDLAKSFHSTPMIASRQVKQKNETSLLLAWQREQKRTRKSDNVLTGEEVEVLGNVKLQCTSLRRNNSRAAKKVINYSEDFDEGINYNRSKLNKIEPVEENARNRMGNKRVKGHASDLKAEDNILIAKPSSSMSAIAEANDKHCEPDDIRTTLQQVPAKKIGKLPPKYGQRLRTQSVCDLGDDGPSVVFASKDSKSPILSNLSVRTNTLAKGNTGRKVLPASCRKRDLTLDITHCGEGVGGMELEVMSSAKPDINCMDQCNQTRPKRERKDAVNNLKPVDSANTEVFNDKGNTGRKDLLAYCRKRNLASDVTSCGEGVVGMGLEVMSSANSDVKGMNQNNQRGPKRGRKDTVNNLKSVDSANAEVSRKKSLASDVTNCSAVVGGRRLEVMSSMKPDIKVMDKNSQRGSKRGGKDVVNDAKSVDLANAEVVNDKGNAGKKELPAVCRKQKLDMTNYGEHLGGMGSEVMSSARLDVEGMDQNKQRGPKRGRTCTFENLTPVELANAKVFDDNGNSFRKELPATCRKQNLTSDMTNCVEGAGRMGLEVMMSGVMPDVKGVDQSNQRGPKRGRKVTINNHNPVDLANPEAFNDKIYECFPVRVNDLSKILAKTLPECQSKFGESQEGIEFATADGVQVSVSDLDDNEVPCKAVASFEDADLPAKVVDCCKQLGKLTILQTYTLPLLLAGHDIFCHAGPSSGQVVTYGVPAMVHILTRKKSFSRTRPSPACLVLTASSELVQQVTQSLEKTFSSLRVKIANIVDGDLTQEEKNTLKPGKAILIATPESLQKALENGRCSLAHVSFLILDRADTMLHGSFETAIRDILGQTPSSRQTAIFASMWLPELEQLLKDAVHRANAVKIGVRDLRALEGTVEGPNIIQIVEVLEETARDTRLTALVQGYQKSQSNRVLVFALYKEEALHIVGLLRQRGWKVTTVHGGMQDTDRTHALVSFRNGSCLILVATDVASRGLAIPYVDYIINYSFPYTLEDYALRLGQTGKTGQSGTVHTFFTLADQAHAHELVGLLRKSEQVVPEELLKMASQTNKHE
ncbi:hypothetical protein O6H91_19G009300 [Diphasiastrum complanatum]|uniref:Uncharacterized protein n=2 Tax=Diphasiastrum complanatum TaxID=34168 RepID=A0ACC2ASN3_DIPCM|nr:hypothetical protein O6H91_19G009300 [Diphasiastrum complanatum]